MDVTAIADPRTFGDAECAAPADAALYAIAARALAAATASERDASDALLRAALAERMRGDGDALAALFAGVPSVDVARALWRGLDAVWHDAIAAQSGVGVHVFAMPVVLVVASADGNDGALAALLSDTAPLDALLREHRMPGGSETAALARALVATDALDVARLPDVLAWHRIEDDAPLRALTPTPIAYAPGRESVHARLLVGSAVVALGIDLFARPAPRGWSMPFTQQLVRALATPRATVLALPDAPLPPLRAVRQAKASQRDVAAQLYASNALRALRARSGEPVAIVSAHRAPDAPGGGELRVSLSSPLEPRDAEGFRCPLLPLERAADVAQMLATLLADCRVADIRVVPGVHSDRVEGSSQRLLFKPQTLPASALH